MRQLALDMCRRRHKGNRESVAAFKHGNKDVAKERVFGVIQAAGANGRTLDEVAGLMAVSPNQISGRVTDLRMDGRIVRTGFRRPTRTGASGAVYVAA